MFHKINYRTKVRGGFFEEEIFMAIQTYRNQGVKINITKLDIPMKYVAGKIIYAEAKPCDFMGGWNRAGDSCDKLQQLAIEAKDIKGTLPLLPAVKYDQKGKKLSLGDGVKYHQLMSLCEMQEQGAHCLILWKRKDIKNNQEKVYAIDPVQARNVVGVGKSINVKDHTFMLREVKKVGLVWDFLNLITTRG